MLGLGDAATGVGAECGLVDSMKMGSGASNVDMQSKNLASCHYGLLGKLKQKLSEDALAKDALVGTFEAPLPDGSVVRLPHMPLLPFCDAA